MADTAPLYDKASPPTVAECAELCFKSFQQCLNQAAAIHYRELSLVEDQLARFSLWSSNIKVFVSGRGSLDHRIREAPDVRDAIVAVLEALDYRIQGCLHVLDSLSPTSHRTLSSIDERLSEALQGIANEISLLHKFLNTIRRASKETQDRGALEAFKIEDDEGNNVEPLLFTLFTNHVRDRFPDASDIIQHRLASTMLQRRKRILYRRFRYGKYHIQPRGTPFQPSIVQPQASPASGLTKDQPREQSQHRVSTNATQNTARSVAMTATTLSPQRFQKASTPSVVSVSRSIALSDHPELRFPPAPCGSLQRRYKKLKQKTQKEHREDLDSIPGESDGLAPRQLIAIMGAKYERILASEWEECLQAVPEIICPFCFCALPVREVIDEKKWSLHVKNDLDPYVCMFEECDSPDELYRHSHEWLKHMRGHSLRWRCTSKSHSELICATKDEYLAHMKTEHAIKLTDAQLKVLAERNGRMIGPMFRSCPLCGIEEVDGSMEQHLVGHLRLFALKSLPSYEEEMEEMDEPDSEQNSFASPQTRSTIRNARDELKNITTRNDESKDNPPSTILYDSLQLDPPHMEREFMDSDSDSDSDLGITAEAITAEAITAEAIADEYLSDEDLSDEDIADEDVHYSERRILEWTFIPHISGFEIDPDDPVALAFQRRYETERVRFSREKKRPKPVQPARLPSNRAEHWLIKGARKFVDTFELDKTPILMSLNIMTRMDPDCAICHAPIALECDCEAKGLEAAVQTAEIRMMAPIYSEIRIWVREHAEKFVMGRLANSTSQPCEAESLQPQESKKVIGSAEIQDDVLSQQERRGALEASLEQYSRAVEYFFGLAELTLPAEEDPAVKDPPLSALSGSTRRRRRGSSESSR
ncbi:hypothetical protein EV127DRAFT_414010 [Xylaria flabelliformis]|nr:hypothetical protein EV127DRAFT_414010 [Xylaria flabelliformis]